MFASLTQQEEGQYAKLSGEVELRNVTFGYSRLGEPLIRDFSIHIKPGRKIYEVTFYKDGYEYEYDIDAESGKVLKFEKELDD